MKIIHNSPDVRPTVLVVDDDQANLEAFRSSFRRDANVLTAINAQEAIAHLESSEVHVLVSDQRMPGVTGDELLKAVKDRFPLVRRYIATAYADIEAIVNAVNDGGLMGYIAKPWKEDQVWAFIQLGYHAYLKEKSTQEYIKQLEENNSKLEFALRQSLLS